MARLERSKKILFILFIVTLLYSFMFYFFIYDQCFFTSLYYALSQFFGGIAHPSSFGIEDFPKYWQLIYIGGFLSFITTTLLIVVKFFNTWAYDLVRASVVGKNNAHVIMCGFGVNNRHIVESILKEGKHKIVVLEKDTENPHIQEYREKGVIFILGDTTQDENLKRAGIDTCDYIIVSAGSDNVNLAIAQKIKLMKIEKKVYVHLEDHLLERNFKDVFSHNFEVFSYNENAVRRLFSEKQLDMGVNTVNSNEQVHLNEQVNEQVHLVVVGLGGLGTSVVVNAIKLGHFYNQKNLKITIVDHNRGAFERFEAYYDFENIPDVDIEFKNYSVHSKTFHDEILSNKINATYIAFCLASDNDTIVAASSIAIKIKQSNKLKKKSGQFPVIAVRLMNDSKLDSNEDIFIFGKNSEISDVKYIINSELDKEAKRSHKAYISGHTDPEKWEELSDSKKDTNRAAADNKSIRVNTIELLSVSTLKSLAQEQENFACNTSYSCYENYSESMQKLIDMEKRRWNAYHIIEGWKNKSDEEIIKIWKNDDNKVKKEFAKFKIHICIVDTKELEAIGLKQGVNYFSNDWNQWKDLIKEKIKEEIKNV